MSENETKNEPENGKSDIPVTGMLPPMILALFLTGGIALDWLIPLNLGHGWGWLGLIMVAGALAFAKWAINTFKTAGTNVPPNLPVTVIVTEGPFKYSRNPMYLSMLVLYAGVALLADAPLMLLLTAGLWAVLNNKVIKAEEAYLEAKFGDEYTDYKERTYRWINPDL